MNPDLNNASYRRLSERADFARRMAGISQESAELDEAAALEQSARGAAADAECARWHARRARHNAASWATKEAALLAQIPQGQLGGSPW